MRILVSGTFDDLHPGHLFLLNEAMKRVNNEESSLWVIVARDANVEKIKGRAPLQSEDQRKKAIEEAFPSATVVLGDEHDFLKPVRDIGPDLILLGYDQHLPPHVSLEDLQCTVERLPAFEPHIHKSSLRRAQQK